MKVQDFSGGLAKRLRPQFLNINQAVEYRNIDSAVNSLAPVKAPIKTDLVLDQYMFYYNEDNDWRSFTTPTACLEYQGVLYTVDGANPRRITPTTDTKLGIDVPLSTFVGAVVPGTGGLNGTYQYFLTYYNSTAGIESGPSTNGVEYVVTSPGHIDLTGLAVSADPQVDKKRLYRIGGSLTTAALVVELSNATTSYSDSLADNAIIGDLLVSTLYLPAPTTLTHIAEYNAMLFGADGFYLRFTPVGVPFAWPIFNSIRYANRVVGSCPTPNGLLVFTTKQVFLVSGNRPDQLMNRLVDSNNGCVSWESIQEFGKAAIWVSKQGICASTGGEIMVVTLDALGEVQFAPISSAVIGKVYYMLDSTGITYAVDTRFGTIIKDFDFPCSTLAVKDTSLFGWSADGIVQLLADPAVNATFKYTSPRFVEGASTQLKSYKKIYIYSEGDIIIRCLIDNKLVATKTLTGNDTHTVSIPEKHQRGHFIQFEIEGTGEVFEIEYEVGMRT